MDLSYIPSNPAAISLMVRQTPLPPHGVRIGTAGKRIGC